MAPALSRRKEGRMNIGQRRRTVYIEPIEEPVTPPLEEPAPAIDPEPSIRPPETEPIQEPAP
jgi:hypothetical protein